MKKKKSPLRILIIPIIILVIILSYRHIQDRLEKDLHPLPDEYLPTIRECSDKYNVPIELLCAVINTESSFNPDAISYANAYGIMQITEETFNWLQYRMGIEGSYTKDKLFDYETNIEFGSYFLYLLYDEFKDWDTALAAYNAGRGSVIKWLSDPEVSQNGELINIPFEETKDYIEKVNKSQVIYKKLYFTSAIPE